MEKKLGRLKEKKFLKDTFTDFYSSKSVMVYLLLFVRAL